LHSMWSSHYQPKQACPQLLWSIPSNFNENFQMKQLSAEKFFFRTDIVGGNPISSIISMVC